MCPAQVYEVGRDGDGTVEVTPVELRPVRRDHRQGRPPDPARGRLRARSTRSPDAWSSWPTSRRRARRSAAACTARRRAQLGARSRERIGARVSLKAELLPAHRLVQAARRADEARRADAGGARARRDRDLGRQPRAGARLRARAPEGIDALVVMWQGASEAKVAATRGYGADGRPRGAPDPTEAFARLDELIERDRAHARPPVRRPAHDRRPGHGRARDRRGRPGRRRRRRPGRRRRARSRASRPP